MYAGRVRKKTSNAGATCQCSGVRVSTGRLYTSAKRLHPHVDPRPADCRLLPHTHSREGGIRGEQTLAPMLAAIGPSGKMGR
jgi:hypothetical protein